MTSSSRADIEALIKKLEDQIQQIIPAIEEKKALTAAANFQAKAAEDAFREAERIARERQEEYREKLRDQNRTVEIAKSYKRDIETLRRQLARQVDADRINQAYLDQLKEFQDKCLDAVWRKENRTDDMGAFEYQIDGAIRLAAAGQGILGDRRGMGKSLTSLIYADLRDATKVIALSPADTMENFAREIHMWAPHRMVVMLGKIPKAQRQFILDHLSAAPNFTVLLNYEAWRLDSTLLDDLVRLQPDTLIMDEAHLIKNFNSTATKGVFKLRFGPNTCPGCDDPRVTNRNDKRYAHCECGHEGPITDFTTVKNVLPMTGTPILNKPQELCPLLMLVDPMNYRSVSQFTQDFCQTTGTRWTWQYGAEERLTKKLGARFVARDRKSVGINIPPPSEVEHLITLEDMARDYPAQYKAYTQARDNAELILDPDRHIAMSMTVWITVLLRLRQVLSWPAGITLKEPDESGEMIEVAKLNVYESAKVDMAERLIRELNDEGERVVLFSQFTGPLVELQSRLGSRTAVYNGSTSASERSAIQLDFDVKTYNPFDTQYDNVLCNYRSGGVGLNFNTAAHMIILDREWNPGKEDQAGGRIDRIGQTKDTTIHTIRVSKSIDTWMDKLLSDKAAMLEGFETATSLSQAVLDALKKGEI